MNTLVRAVWPFVVRHWFKIGVGLLVIFLFTQKSINLSLQFGQPSGQPPAAPAAAPPPAIAERESGGTLTDASEKPGLLDRLNIFSSKSDGGSLLERLRAADEAEVNAFIRRFSNVAQVEQQKFGIPASITLAGALLHSQAGTAAMTVGANNFFGLGCDSDWRGSTFRVGLRCVRSYDNAWTSFRDHSLYITTGSYAPLTKLSKSDYRSWAAALEEADFNDTDNLARQLIELIDQRQLFQYD